MYTFFYRSAPHPLFGTFDAPDFQVTCTRRPRSNTPLQSLALANDPAFLECARALAVRLFRECPGDFATVLDDRLRLAFRHALQRDPSPSELGLLRGHVDRQRMRFLAAAEASPEAAQGAGRFEAMSSLGDTAESAALASAVRVLFNLDTFITRE
jgi:hypothetical protein